MVEAAFEAINEAVGARALGPEGERGDPTCHGGGCGWLRGCRSPGESRWLVEPDRDVLRLSSTVTASPPRTFMRTASHRMTDACRGPRSRSPCRRDPEGPRDRRTLPAAGRCDRPCPPRRESEIGKHTSELQSHHD